MLILRGLAVLLLGLVRTGLVAAPVVKNREGRSSFGHWSMRGVLSVLLLVTLVIVLVQPCHGWENGSESTMIGECSRCYGTHDFLAEHALAFLPFDPVYSWLMTSHSNPKDRIANEEYLYGTEMPDQGGIASQIGTVFKADRNLHAVYYSSDGTVEDDYAARRAQESYNMVIYYLRTGSLDYAARWMGITSHYVTDVTSYGHVMGKGEDWIKASPHRPAYEHWVNEMTDMYNAPFSSCLVFDGGLERVSPYEVTMKLAYDTTFDTSGKGKAPQWMEANYDTTSKRYIDRVCESLNLATNALADLIYSTTLDVTVMTSTATISASSVSTAAATSSAPLTTSIETTTVASTTAIVGTEPFPYLNVGIVATISLIVGMVLAYSWSGWSRKKPARTTGSQDLSGVNAT